VITIDEPIVVRRRRPRWPVVTGGTLLGLIAAVLFAAAIGVGSAEAVGQSGVTYTSTAALLIDQQRLESVATDPSVIAKLALLRVKYVGLVPTDAIVVPVARMLGVAPGQVRGHIGATAQVESLILTVSGSSADPTFARRLAAATASELITYVQQEQASANVPVADRYSFSLVDPASSAVVSSPSDRRSITVGAAAAVIVLLVGLAVVYRRSLTPLP
jgi:capsular polysaccharide biosynthesis protein